MHKTLTPRQQSEDDQLSGNSEVVDTDDTSVSIGGRPLCNLQFADDIDLLIGSEEELQQLAEGLEKPAADYGMEIRSDKQKQSQRH